MVIPARRTAVALLSLIVWPVVPSPAQTLTVDTIGDTLKIRAPAFSFLKGDPLARLKDGRSVRVELTAMVLPAPGKTAVATARRIFALSYDLWEERFAVTTVDRRSQSVSHLALAAAEAWCIEQLGFPVSALGTLGRDPPFWVRLEYHVLDGDSTSDQSEPGYTLQALIDAFSRRRKSDSSPHAIEAGPFKLSRKTQSSEDAMAARVSAASGRVRSPGDEVPW